jgi:flagellin-like hook-associated protein FlgL
MLQAGRFEFLGGIGRSAIGAVSVNCRKKASAGAVERAMGAVDRAMGAVDRAMGSMGWQQSGLTER